KLPEADDSFIDHFTNLIDDYHVKLKKMEGLQKKEKKVAAPKITASSVVEPAPIQQLSVRGKPAPKPTSDKLYFDDKKGVLHIPGNKRHSGGQFKMYIPGKHDPMIHKAKGD